MLLQNGDGGALLLVAGDPGKEYITTISYPCIITLNIQDATTFGGRDWEETFLDTALLQLLKSKATPIFHVVIASCHWKTCIKNSSQLKLEFMQATKPILVAPGELAGATMENSTVPIIVFLPKLCYPPVGWYFKTSSTFD